MHHMIVFQWWTTEMKVFLEDCCRSCQEHTVEEGAREKKSLHRKT